MVSGRDTPQRFAHQSNNSRYRKMLAGHLTPAERDFVKHRIGEEQEAMRKLAESSRQEVQTQ